MHVSVCVNCVNVTSKHVPLTMSSINEHVFRHFHPLAYIHPVSVKILFLLSLKNPVSLSSLLALEASVKCFQVQSEC